MSNDITHMFFHWMEANNIGRRQAAELLDIDERSLSTYRSRGLPRKKHARALQVMADHDALTMSASQVEANRLVIHFTEMDYNVVEKAALLTKSSTREFVSFAAVQKAREITGDTSLKVAEDTGNELSPSTGVPGAQAIKYSPARRRKG